MGADQQPGNAATPYVLLIEDDAATRRLVKDILEVDVGVAVVEASDGEKALRLLTGAGDPPALLVVDLMLPNMDGETFMTEVRRLYGPDLPILVMSAMDPKLVRSSADHVGAQTVVLKPFHVRHFIAQASDALRLDDRPGAAAPIIDLSHARKLRRAG